MSDGQMEFSEVLNAGNPNDFKKIYDASKTIPLLQPFKFL